MDKWVPVGEKLPSDARQVIVTVYWGNDDYEVSVAEYWDSDGWGGLNVIAWQELPEPYKEKENANKIL